MTELEKLLHRDLGFVIEGTQVLFIVFIDGRCVTRAVMPARQTDIQMWNLLMLKQKEVHDLHIEWALTKQALEVAKQAIAKIEIRPYDK